MSYESLNVSLDLTSHTQAPRWAVRLRRGGLELQTWLEASEEEATKRYSDVEAMLTLLEAIESTKKGAH